VKVCAAQNMQIVNYKCHFFTAENRKDKVMKASAALCEKSLRPFALKINSLSLCCEKYAGC
jgi:hypothetical protein